MKICFIDDILGNKWMEFQINNIETQLYKREFDYIQDFKMQSFQIIDPLVNNSDSFI